MTPKPFTVLDCEQRSPEWYAARAGVFTASRAGEAFGKTQKGAWYADRKDYRTELVIERVTGKPAEDRFNGRTPRIVTDGIEREAAAIRLYENLNGVLVRPCGFVLDNEIPVGCSPDGVIGDFEGLIQAKCPKASTHLATVAQQRAACHAIAKALVDKLLVQDKPSLLLACIPSEYIYQIRHELYVTGAMWCDYLSYHPDFPKHLQLVTIRVMASDVDLLQYAQDVRVFLDEVETECEKIAGWAA